MGWTVCAYTCKLTEETMFTNGKNTYSVTLKGERGKLTIMIENTCLHPIPDSENSSIPLWWEAISWGSPLLHFLPRHSFSPTPDKYPSTYFLFHPLTLHHFSCNLLQILACSSSPSVSLLLSPLAHSAFPAFILLSHPFLSPSLSFCLCVWSPSSTLAASFSLKCEKRNGKIWRTLNHEGV